MLQRLKSSRLLLGYLIGGTLLVGAYSYAAPRASFLVSSPYGTAKARQDHNAPSGARTSSRAGRTGLWVIGSPSGFRGGK